MGLINLPVVQKKILSKVCNVIQRKNNFIIQYEDVVVKYFHTISVKNLKIFNKGSNKSFFSVGSFRLSISPFSWFFRRVFCFSDIDIESIDADFLGFVKDLHSENSFFHVFLSFFCVEINNLKIKKSSLKIKKNFFLTDFSGIIKKCFLSNKTFSADIEEGSFFFNEDFCSSFVVGFSFFFKTKRLNVDRLSFVSNYGVFDGEINVEDLTPLLEMDWKNLEVSIVVNKFLFPVSKIEDIKISQFLLNKNIPLSLAGEFFFKKNSVFLKNFSVNYLNSFSFFSLEIENVFDYKKIKYSMFCDKVFLNFKDFDFPVDVSIKNKINACSFIQKTFSLRGDLFSCLVDVDFYTGFGRLKSTIKMQNKPSQNTFFCLQKIQADGFLFDNVFSFWPGFKNITTRFGGSFDVLSKDFSFTLNLDRCKYEEEIFQNISLFCQGNGVAWNGKVLVKDDIFSTNLSLSFCQGIVDVYGSLSVKRLPFSLQKVFGNKLKHVKTDVRFGLTRNRNGFSLLGDFSNFSFFYLEDAFFDEKIFVNFGLKDNFCFLDFKSSFLDATTKNVPLNVVKNFSATLKKKDNFLSFNGFLKFPIFIAIKKPFFSFFSFLKKTSMPDFCLSGDVKNDDVFSFCGRVETLENIVAKNIKIKPFNIDFSFAKKNDQGWNVSIKSDSLVFNKIFFSLRINALCSSEKEIKGTLEYCEKNKKKHTVLFSFNKEHLFWVFSFNSSLWSGKVGFNSNICFVDNLVLKDDNGKNIFSFCVNIDLVKKSVENIKMFCNNINIGWFSLLFARAFGGVCSCDINSERANLKICDLMYDNIFYGDVHAKIKKEKDFFSVVVDLFDKKNICNVSGKYFGNKMVDFKVVFNDFGLKKINPLMSKIMCFNGGSLSGSWFLSGSFVAPKFCGGGQIVSGNVLFYDTGTFCQDLSATLWGAGDNKINFGNMKTYDHNKSLLSANGFLEFVSLTNVKGEFSCELNNFELLNIRLEDNGFVSGGGCFSGKVKISFGAKKLDVVCDLKSHHGSVAIFCQGSEAYSSDFISVFETKTAFFIKKNKKWKDNGVFLSGCVDFGEEFFFVIQFNQYFKITSNGCGKIKFSTDCKSLFDFHGVYTLKKGDLFLNLYDIVSKSFCLKPGGVCDFNGPINSIRLNLVAESEIDSFSYKGISQSVDVVVTVGGTVLNFDLKYSVVSKLGEVFFVSQNFNINSIFNSDSAYLEKFFSIFLYKTLDPNNTYSALVTTQLNSFFNDFLNKKLGDKNFKLTVDFSSLFYEDILHRRLKYDFVYKVTDKIFLYKSGFFDSINSFFENVSLRCLLTPGVWGSLTFLPQNRFDDDTNGLLSVGLFLSKDFNI